MATEPTQAELVRMLVEAQSRTAAIVARGLEDAGVLSREEFAQILLDGVDANPVLTGIADALRGTKAPNLRIISKDED